MIILIMGTTGSGKTTIGKELARQLGWRFIEGDDYHPRTNVEKMASGQPLNDADREPWLDKLRTVIDDSIDRREDAVVAASALSEAHRKKLRIGNGVTLVYLKGDKDLIRQRVRNRKGHFAKEALLEDQFARLEEPADATSVSIDRTPARIVGQILAQIDERGVLESRQ